MTPEEIQEVVNGLGLPKFTGKQLVDWIYSKRVASFEAMSNLSKKSRELLAEQYEVGLYAPLKEQISKAEADDLKAKLEAEGAKVTLK